MKIIFIRPGDKIVLLENGLVENTVNNILEEEKKFESLGTGLNFLIPPCEKKAFIESGNHFVPKGTELIVNQIYIRKNGWFEDSITFIVPKDMTVGNKKVVRIKLTDVEDWNVDLIRAKR